MLAYVRYDKAKFQYDLTNQYFRASVTPGRTLVNYLKAVAFINISPRRFSDGTGLLRFTKNEVLFLFRRLHLHSLENFSKVFSGFEL